MSRIWLDDVAEAISSTRYPNDYVTAMGLKNNLMIQLRDAALNGELACYNSVGKYKPRAYEKLISTTKEAVNLWLYSIDSPYRYGQTEDLGDAETGNHAGTVKPRKKLKPLERETNEGLLLIYEIFNYYKVEYLDELPAHKAWGKIISKEFNSDSLSSIACSNKSITLSGGEKISKTDFGDKYRRRFE